MFDWWTKAIRSLRLVLGPANAVPVRGTATSVGFLGAIVREPYTGAWQANAEIRAESVLASPAVFAGFTLIAGDIGKVRLRLVELTDDAVWIETTSAAFSPVLRKPNRYQTIGQFLETWIFSKLIHGNTYVLKERDASGIVRALYILDPARVCPLVTPSGDIYYELRRDDISGIAEQDGKPLVAPSSEVIHDRFNCLFHPLVGVSPLFACGGAAIQGLSIQSNSSKFFASGAQPGGVLTAPGHIHDDTAARLKEYWNTQFSGSGVGKVAVVSDGLKYEPMTATAVDSQLIEQLNWTTKTVATTLHIPASLLDASIQAPYGNNTEPLLQMYYSQCLQSLMTAIETCFDSGLELPTPYGTEFDIDDLIWFDTKTRTTAATDTIRGGALSPDEARHKYFGLGPVDGGDSPYLQQQNFSLRALAERDANDPFAKPSTPVPATPANPEDTPDDESEIQKSLDELRVAIAELEMRSRDVVRWKRAFVEGTSYIPGDVVVFNGGSWCCITPTTLSPHHSRDWQLMARPGKRGKDARA